MEIFGFQIKRKNDSATELRSFAEPVNDDGALSVAAGGGAQSTFVDLEGSAKTEAELITRYRSMMLQAEVQSAVDDIINEMVNITDDEKPVECVTDDIKVPDTIKKKIREEFDGILDMLDFSNQAYNILSNWYVDGRLNYHVLIDEARPKLGIQELRFIDPRKLRKIREFEDVKDGTYNTTTFKKIKNEYFMYSEKGFDSGNPIMGTMAGLKIAKDSILNTNSGILNEKNTVILSHLHKAYKPLNQLRMMEDASVIYRITRAPERRVFYIDVGNLPKVKAEQHLREMMTNHKNKLVYDASTGEVKDDRKFMTMTDDFWLPRREGNRGTEIVPLSGGQNLGEIEDIQYFQKKLYKSLNVPISRLESDSGFSLGRASEISRDEVKFSKFVRRLRTRFAILFDKALERQLILKGIIRSEEWDDIKNDLRYNFKADSHFEEMKDIEMLRERMSVLGDAINYVGEGSYFSKTYLRKHVLRQTEDEINEMKKENAEEAKEFPENPTGTGPDEEEEPEQDPANTHNINISVEKPKPKDKEPKK